MKLVKLGKVGSRSDPPWGKMRYDDIIPNY